MPSGYEKPAEGRAPSIVERIVFGVIVFLMIAGWLFFPACAAPSSGKRRPACRNATHCSSPEARRGADKPRPAVRYRCADDGRRREISGT